MKNKLIRYWIILRSLFTTVKYSLLVLFSIKLGKATRESNNNYIRAWAHKLLDIIELDYQIFNPHNIDFKNTPNCIVMCNHSSLYDIPISLVAINGTLRMLAKKELSRIPIFGRAMEKSEFVFIDRQNRKQAIEDLEKAKSMMQSGVTLWVAPEGTRSIDGNLLPFKKGGFMMALQTGALIVPIGIRGARNIVEKKTFKIKHRQKVEVHIGKPIEAPQYSIKQINQLMQDVETAMREAVGLV